MHVTAYVEYRALTENRGCVYFQCGSSLTVSLGRTKRANVIKMYTDFVHSVLFNDRKVLAILGQGCYHMALGSHRCQCKNPQSEIHQNEVLR